MKYDYLIVGTKLYVSVLAERLNTSDKKVLIAKKCPRIAGNIYTEKAEMI